MATIYIDECGDEGFQSSSSEWFILGGVLHSFDGTMGRMVEAYDGFKDTYCNENWHFHFNKKTHDERVAFISTMRECGVRGLAVAIHKPSLREKERFKQKYWLYFYALRFLLEKATNWCKKIHQEPLLVILSDRGGLSTDSLQAYLDRICDSPFTGYDKMAWDYLDHSEDILIAPNKRYRGLQMADCIASSIGKAVECSRFQTLEPRYLAELHPIFHMDGFSYQKAIKVWPYVSSEIWQRGFLPAYEMGDKLAA